MIEQIERYNLGFGGWGPLEQSDEGRIMMAEDVIRYADGVVKKNQELMDEFGDMALSLHNAQEHSAALFSSLSEGNALAGEMMDQIAAAENRIQELVAENGRLSTSIAGVRMDRDYWLKEFQEMRAKNVKERAKWRFERHKTNVSMSVALVGWGIIVKHLLTFAFTGHL